MCQILCLTSHDPAALHDIIQKVWASMSCTQKDGFGAAWRSPDGQIGYLKRRYPKIDGTMPTSFVKPVLKSPEPFSESNDLPSDGGFLIIHGRAATNEVNVANTHPFVDTLEDGRRVALIHNGVVRSTKYDNILDGCTCDSELLLRAYTDGGIDSVERHVDGRYAFMYLEVAPPSAAELAAATPEAPALDKTTLHIAKDYAQNLHCGLLPDETFVIATTEGLIKEVGGTVEGEVDSNRLIIFTGKTSFTEERFRTLTYAEKQTAAYQDRLKTNAQAPTQATHHYPAKTDKTQLEKDIETEEEAEIRALEMAPIEIVS